MNDPRLTRLAELWQRSLETGLGSAEEAELQALLGDAALAEAWAEQVGSAALEEAPAAAEAGALPSGLRSEFRRHYRPVAYWSPRLAVPAVALLMGWMLWPSGQRPSVPTVMVDEQPYQELSSDPTPRPQRPDLGPPPGLDERRHLLVDRSQRALYFEVELERPAQVKARIMDASGKTVKVLNFGPRAAGTASIVWDGRLKGERGERLAPAGRYHVQVYFDGDLGAEKDLLVEKR